MVEWIDAHFQSFDQEVRTNTICTSLAYDLSRVEAVHYNICIRASLTSLLGDPGSWTLVLFQMLIDELTWGWYQCQPLHVSLKQLLLPADGKGKHKLIHQSSPLGGANPIRDNQGRGNGRDNEPIANPCPLARLQILLGKNTNDILRNILLPTISDCTFYERCHLGISCFTQCARIAPYIHPPHVTIDAVLGALITERLAVEAARK